MEISNKRLNRTAKLVYFLISAVLCTFLILLTNNIISDIDSMVDYPQETSYQDTKAIDRIQRKTTVIDDTLKRFELNLAQIDKAIALASQNYANEKQSYDNWIEARKTIGSPNQDLEVLNRAQKLDEFYKIQEEWNAQRMQISDKISYWNTLRNQNEDLKNAEYSKASEQYADATRDYETMVFVIRLLFVLPILAIGIFLFVRLRKHKFWPLLRGFSYFSLYAFFFGLVPYLPSYGGYIRYTVGAILSVLLGGYAIKRFKQYFDRKKQELESSTKDRSLNIQSETAERALNAHVCPSCGKDFITKNWEIGSEQKSTNITNYCRFCGLELFAPCLHCNTVSYVHLPFCMHCGTRREKS